MVKASPWGVKVSSQVRWSAHSTPSGSRISWILPIRDIAVNGLADPTGHADHVILFSTSRTRSSMSSMMGRTEKRYRVSKLVRHFVFSVSVAHGNRSENTTRKQNVCEIHGLPASVSPAARPAANTVAFANRPAGGAGQGLLEPFDLSTPLGGRDAVGEAVTSRLT